ncbi:hypothetical protein [Medusavirus stheno T3]|uniref:Uncharacterized protein n=1 Tax=Medusavirus stheno T3 TaxID=3069717 RepID=A0A7S7YEW8_9VIRU|nr:hypothetical protein QKU73_gp237 [Acanthamoeba castellanii medusavirus]QPB44538.1 hypothetical protein [Medusavirus stheno T3]
MDPYGIVDNMEASATTEVAPMDIANDSDGDGPMAIDPPAIPPQLFLNNDSCCL